MDERLKQKFARLHGTVWPYAALSFVPPIFYIQLHGNALDQVMQRYEMLFTALQGRRAYCIFCNSFDLTPWLVRGVRQMESELNSRFPNLELIHLGNTVEHCRLLAEAGERAIFCNQNCFIDERIFRPDPAVTQRLDAVYDATLTPIKRHHLANRIASLGLIYYPTPYDHPDYVARIKHELAYAHWFNHDAAGTHHLLNPMEVARALNGCRVGLCLSDQEGAMWASMQYLLSGLPVVTTPSEGGRDEFFDARYVRTVPAEAEAVARAVAELVAARLDPEAIRRATLEKVQPHRGRFIALVQELYDRSGVNRRFADEWNAIFFNRMIAQRSHLETIARMQQAWAGSQA
jgi:glycosyltransferase involved in cell wall biosynthesis